MTHFFKNFKDVDFDDKVHTSVHDQHTTISNEETPPSYYEAVLGTTNVVISLACLNFHRRTRVNIFFL